MTYLKFALSGAVVGTALLVGAATTVLAQEADTFEVEFFGGGTMRLEGSRAVVSTFDARAATTADSGARKMLPSLGLAVSRWGRVLGSYVDFSYVDGGRASAYVGSNASDVTSRVFDFHGGLQLQYPGGRVRPYVLAAGGFARPTTTMALTLFGDTTTIRQSEWVTSFVYGGGLRLGLSDSAGIRVALEGVTVSPIRSDSAIATTSYGRFVVGVFLSGGKRSASPVPLATRVTAPALERPMVDKPANVNDTRQTIDEIRDGAHGTIPPPQRTGNNVSGATTVTYENQTAQVMLIYLSGPETRTLTLAPWSTENVSLEAGQYEIGVRVASGAAQSFYGTHEYAGGMSHGFAFSIETSIIRLPIADFN